MNELNKILEKLQAEDVPALREVMAYCKKRVTADEAIPAIIGLDDLTNTEDTVYTPAESDVELGLVLAAGALIFNSLYEEYEEKDPAYPNIAPSMSALAEKVFRAQYKDDEFTVVPYREVVSDFIK